MIEELKKGVEAEREPNFLLAPFAIGLAIAGVMLVLLTGRAFQNLRELAKDEPAAPRR